MKRFLLLVLAICDIGDAQALTGRAQENIPRPEILWLRTGETLAKELDSFKREGSLPKSQRPSLEVSFSNSALISLRYDWETMGAYLSSGRIYHVFELSTCKEVILWDQIKPSERKAFENLLRSRIQPLLNKHRKKYPTKDWEDVFQEGDHWDPQLINSKFLVTGLDRFKTFYITKGSVHFMIDGYWGFPHASQALDFSCDVPIQFAELNLFIKDSSVLRF